MKGITLVVAGGVGLSSVGCRPDPNPSWTEDVRLRTFEDMGGGVGEASSGTADAGSGSGDICEILEPCNAIDCIPRNLYGRVAADEYYNECRNYCDPDAHCFDRATTMLGALDEVCTPDLRGADGNWCDELAQPGDQGTCDDLVFKVIIRYPVGYHWSYHVASLVKTCEDGMCVIDPMGRPSTLPTTTCFTPQEWCDAAADGYPTEWHDTVDMPPWNTAYCEIVPARQQSWIDQSVSDPTDRPTVAQACEDLSKHVAKMCTLGKKPFPKGCNLDVDDDGIPDKWDKCPNSPPNADVDYCDPNRLGCAPDENDTNDTDTTGGSGDGNATSGDTGYGTTSGGGAQDGGGWSGIYDFGGGWSSDGGGGGWYDDFGGGGWYEDVGGGGGWYDDFGGGWYDDFGGSWYEDFGGGGGWGWREDVGGGWGWYEDVGGGWGGDVGNWTGSNDDVGGWSYYEDLGGGGWNADFGS